MEFNPAGEYFEVFFSNRSVDIMRAGRILPPDGTPARLLADLTARLDRAERALGEDGRDAEEVIGRFYDYVRRGICVLGSPLLTNVAAGNEALGSCSAAPIDVSALTKADLDLAETYYKLNMGSGYDLTPAADPVMALIRLNEHAAAVENSSVCERYVGNIAHVSVTHPRVLDFIALKTRRRDIVHFNTSVDMTEEFMAAVLDGNGSDGDAARNARGVWEALVNAAWECGDPGIISLQRYNADNALSELSPYVTTAPCAEVGLAPGESCVFGYINLAACIRPGPQPSIDLDVVGSAANCLTRVLDDALELSLVGLPIGKSNAVMAAKRKIGIGVCGFADALLWLGIDYGGETSVRLLADVLATINYESKRTSVDLAKRRGTFTAFGQSAYARDRAFLHRFKGFKTAVPDSEWDDLSESVTAHGLRNVMTTALPPSGRSALLLGVNPSIEPYLALHDGKSFVTPLRALLAAGRAEALDDGSVTLPGRRRTEWPRQAADRTSLFRTSTQLSAAEHFGVFRAAAGLVDDGVSKTINLPSGSTPGDVDAIYRAAWSAGLKAISVYRMPA